MLSLFFLVVFFYLGAEAGASWSWSPKWQTNSFKRAIPEILLAVILTVLSSTVHLSLGLNPWWLFLTVPLSTVTSYAGIQTTRWLFIQWDTKHKDFNTGREATIKPFVDWLARKLGVEQGTESYSWISATIVGTIISLPFAFILAPISGLLFAFGYEIGSHAKKYLKGFNQHIISEGMSFALVGAFALLVIGIL